MKLRLICYDINDDKVRLRIAKLLKQYGCSRLQKSVFVGWQSELDYQEMIDKISNQFTNKIGINDSIYVMPLSKVAFEKMTKIGKDPLYDKILEKELFMWI